VTQGNIGAGLGATVGKLRGIKFSTKGGVGSSSTVLTNGVKVGALVVTNAVGNVFNGDGKTVAGTRIADNYEDFLEIESLIEPILNKEKSGRQRATTIGLVTTNLELSHEEAIRVVQMAHDGLARCIRPVHAATDGDTLFSASTGEITLKKKVSEDLITLIGHVASSQVTKSVLKAVQNSKALNGIPAGRNFELLV
jgi:L-aminopeptidase/D-esterase-like protein